MILSDVLYIKELGYNFSSSSSDTNLIPIVLDATVDYSKKYTATVTTSPVGSKSDRADNYRVKPSSISFSGVISNLDIGIYSNWAMNSVDISTQNNKKELEKALGNSTYTFNSGSSRAQQYVERLEKIIKDKILVEVRIPDGLTTTNCLITSLDISRSTKIGDGFNIRVTATQIQMVDVSIITEPLAEVKDAVSSKEEGGTGAGSPISTTSEMGTILVEKKLKLGGR